MKIHELITILQSFDSNLDVVYLEQEDSEYDGHPLIKINISEVLQEDDYIIIT